MSEASKCPRCGAAPILTKEEDFLQETPETWGIFHVCPKGFNVDEGPCLSASDAIDAWNLQVEESKGK